MIIAPPGDGAVTIPCVCCQYEDDDDDEGEGRCFTITAISFEGVSARGCDSSAFLTHTVFPICFLLSVPLDQIVAQISGYFVVDCGQEESGYCRNRGASGTYPWNGPQMSFRAIEEYENSIRVDYDFEDCFDLPPADYIIRIYLSRIIPEPEVEL